MIDWTCISTVFLDMDGTLLDLRFDNHFWLEHVPMRFSEKHSYPLEQAREVLYARYRSVEGTLAWYSVDYWSRQLELDISALKQEMTHLISVHPHVVNFLRSVAGTGRRLVLLTNAHVKSVDIKLAKTELGQYFDRIIVSHDLGEPKESVRFWPLLKEYEPHEPARTLLVDDNLSILRMARRHGIAHLLAVKRPDTQGREIDSEEFEVIENFSEILPG
ncbi:MAG: GMP/IMP nucleotidase [Pseudomonadota bacterium]